MKNQYFGDINDYRKYGLLRCLSNEGEIRIAICWILTADDKGGDGGKTAYLHQPDRYRSYDAQLFDSLATCLGDPANRSVAWAETSGILPGAVFYDRLLTDVAAARHSFFREFDAVARGCDLVFFDPDNGLETKSTPYGRRASHRYLYWRELSATYGAGHSVLVYQHFRREKRGPFIQAMSEQVCEHTGAPAVIPFRTGNVVFLLLPQPRHQDFFWHRAREVERAWGSQISVVRSLIVPGSKPLGQGT